jgi:hypothetical protein
LGGGGSKRKLVEWKERYCRKRKRECWNKNICGKYNWTPESPSAGPIMEMLWGFYGNVLESPILAPIDSISGPAILMWWRGGGMQCCTTCRKYILFYLRGIIFECTCRIIGRVALIYRVLPAFKKKIWQTCKVVKAKFPSF